MKSINRDRLIFAIVGGVIFLILPRDPWNIKQYFLLLFCSTAGSVFGVLFTKGYVISILIGSILFLFFTLIFDMLTEPDTAKYIAEFIMWSPILAINSMLYVGTVTLVVHPLVSIIKSKIKG
jgi:hypothetical protein